MSAFLLMLCFCWMPSTAQHYWPQSQVDEIFNILYTQGARAAILEVEAEDLTSYDFGAALVLIGERTKALAWYTALAVGVENRGCYLFLCKNLRLSVARIGLSHTIQPTDGSES